MLLDIRDRHTQFKLLAILGVIALLLGAGRLYGMWGSAGQPYILRGKVYEHDGSTRVGSGHDVQITNLDTSDTTTVSTNSRSRYQYNLGNFPSGWSSGDDIKVELINNDPYHAVVMFTIGSGGLDDDDNDGSSKRVNMIQNQQPTADIVGSDRTWPKTTIISLSGADSSDPDGDTLTYKWDYDDIDGLDWASPDDTGLTTTFNIGASVRTVTLQVDDGTTQGYNTDTDSIMITPTNTVPAISDITRSPTGDIDPDENIEYTCSASDSDGDTLQYRWDYDNDGNWDSSYSTSSSSTTSYSQSGESYTPKCQVYDGMATDSMVASFSVYIRFVWTTGIGPGFHPWALTFDDSRSMFDDAHSLMSQGFFSTDSMIFYWDMENQAYSDAYIKDFSDENDSENFGLSAGVTYFIYNPGTTDIEIVVKGRPHSDVSMSFVDAGWYYLPYVGATSDVASYYEGEIGSYLLEAIEIDDGSDWFGTSYIVGFHSSLSPENFALNTVTFVLLNTDGNTGFTWEGFA